MIDHILSSSQDHIWHVAAFESKVISHTFYPKYLRIGFETCMSKSVKFIVSVNCLYCVYAHNTDSCIYMYSGPSWSIINALLLVISCCHMVMKTNIHVHAPRITKDWTGRLHSPKTYPIWPQSCRKLICINNEVMQCLTAPEQLFRPPCWWEMKRYCHIHPWLTQ